jgi:outer membrane receptor protein involved in Fe transport
VEGPVGSDRLPAYRRLDLQLSYYIPLGDGQSLTLYAAVNNALDRANVIDVTYAPDYQTRTEQTTNFERSVYAGLTMTL